MFQNTKKQTVIQLTKIKQYCSQRGIKLTPLRETILVIMCHFEQAISAYEILRQLRKVRPNAEPPTVYRVLEYLQQAHIIHRIASKNTYLCCIHPDVPHRGQGQLLLCDRCEQADEVFDGSLKQAFADYTKTHGFQFRDDLIEIHGVCAKCAIVS